MRQGVYNGSYIRLGNVPMSQAYASALNISLDVCGGLPVRRIRHWAADLMLVSIMARLLRVFSQAPTQAARGHVAERGDDVRPGDGRGLPRLLAARRQLSGTGIRIARDAMEGVAVAGTYLTFSCPAASSPERSSSAISTSSTCPSSPG